MQVTRRDFVKQGAMASAAMVARQSRGVRESASQPSTRVTFEVPVGACDCHTHIFGDPARFPFAPARTYTPEPASIDEMRRLHHALHISRVVVVQPSVYGTDNACTLDAIRQLAPNARGVAVIDDRVTGAALDEMDRIGIRGVRINLATAGQTDPEVGRRRFGAAIETLRAGNRTWHIQINTQLSMIDAMRKELAASPVPVVFDHFGGAQAALGLEQRGFDVLLDLVRTGRVYVKLSAPYLGSMAAPDYADLAPLAEALIRANVHRVLWGTDWPHPSASQAAGRTPADISPLRQIDDGRVFNQFAMWAPNAADRKTILVDNPNMLYGFARS